MPFPPRFLDELIARSDLTDLVGSYVPLTWRGGRYWACCPFHNEKTPSFSVSPDKQQYYCFGCHKGGGVITFVREIENLSYEDAVYFLAKRAGISVPEERVNREAVRRRARILQLNRDAARFYYQLLHTPEGRAVREYLDQRRIGRPVAVKFGLGASADAWDTLLNAMTRKGYEKQELLDAGLIVANRKGGFHDKFRNRLMLPVIDLRGDVIAFGSRVLDGSQPKYMNSADTPVYSKRRTLYGLNLARKTRRSNLILCEGNLDVITLHQAGFDNAVATMGTALTEQQIGELVRTKIPELVLCYDNDDAGQAATQKALSLLRRSALNVRVLQLPRRVVNGSGVKQDPDDFIKYQGPEAFERLLDGSESGDAFRMDRIAEKYDLSSDDGRIAYTNEVREFLASLPPGSAEREIYTVRAAEIARVPRNVMERETANAESFRQRRQKRAEERRVYHQPAISAPGLTRSLRYDHLRSARAEEGLIRLLLYDPGLFTAPPPLEDFSSPLLRNVCGALWKAYTDGRQPGLNILSETLNAEEMGHITAVSEQPVSPSGAPKALSDYIRVIREEAQQRAAAEHPPAQTGEDLLSLLVEQNAAKQKNITQDVGGNTP